MRISDWSSDVCSSDLNRVRGPLAAADRKGDPCSPKQGSASGDFQMLPAEPGAALFELLGLALRHRANEAVMAARRSPEQQIGRAAWRERMCQYVSISVAAVHVKKTTIHTNNKS